jgi:hypothetical protein
MFHFGIGNTVLDAESLSFPSVNRSLSGVLKTGPTQLPNYRSTLYYPGPSFPVAVRPGDANRL